MIRLWIYILLGVLGLSSCINQPENTNIPNKRVSFLIDTSLSGSDNMLHDCNYGMTKIYTKDKPAKLSMQGSYGVCGVIVVRTIDNTYVHLTFVALTKPKPNIPCNKKAMAISFCAVLHVAANLK